MTCLKIEYRYIKYNIHIINSQFLIKVDDKKNYLNNNIININSSKKIPLNNKRKKEKKMINFTTF